MGQALNVVLGLILALFHIVIAIVVIIENGVRHLLGEVGIGGTAAQVVLILVALVLIVAALRLTGRVFGVLIAIFLVLLLLHVLLPGLGAGLGTGGAGTHV